MVKTVRWKIAQDSEKEYWNLFTKKQLFRKFGGIYLEKNKILLKEWSKYLDINKNTKILQIGCAALDIINYIPSGKKYAIDPLADYFKEKFKIDYKPTKFIRGVGEDLPFVDNSFDIVILANVLDHMKSPEKALFEIKRVLKPNGIFYLETHVSQSIFLIISKIWGFLKENFTGKMFNIHHPYMFSLNDIKKMVLDKFKIIEENLGRDIGRSKDFEEFKIQKKKDKKIRIRLLANLGIYGEICYGCILKKY